VWDTIRTENGAQAAHDKMVEVKEVKHFVSTTAFAPFCPNLDWELLVLSARKSLSWYYDGIAPQTCY